MKQEQNKPSLQPQTKVEAPQQRDVLTEIAGGYLLAATIMSFLGLWMVGIANLGISA